MQLSQVSQYINEGDVPKSEKRSPKLRSIVASEGSSSAEAINVKRKRGCKPGVLPNIETLKCRANLDSISDWKFNNVTSQMTEAVADSKLKLPYMNGK